MISGVATAKKDYGKICLRQGAQTRTLIMYWIII